MPRRQSQAFGTVVVLGIGAVIVGLIGSARVCAQVGPEESAARYQAGRGAGGDPVGRRADGRQPDEHRHRLAGTGLGHRGPQLPLHPAPDQPYIDDADRIKILEDTDGDGKADKVTVFADKIFPVPMGIAVEEHYDRDGNYTGCKVYVGNSPDLLVLEDTDGDDRADKRYPAAHRLRRRGPRPRRARHGVRPRRQALLHPGRQPSQDEARLPVRGHRTTRAGSSPTTSSPRPCGPTATAPSSRSWPTGSGTTTRPA